MRKTIFILSVLLYCMSTNARLVLDLKHTSSILFLKKSDNYLASQDRLGFWCVWDLDTDKPIVSGSTNMVDVKAIDFSNKTMVVNNRTSFSIYHLPNIKPIDVKTDSLYNVFFTPNGKHIWSATVGKNLWKLNDSHYVNVWDLNGKEVLSLKGNRYENSIINSDSLELYVAIKGEDSLCAYSISNPSNRRSVHFSGGFNSWLSDQTFLTTQGSVVRTYSFDGTQLSIEDVGNPDGLSGYGSYFWCNQKLYKVNSKNNPISVEINGDVGVNRTLIAQGYMAIFLEYNYSGVVDSILIYKLGPDSVSSVRHAQGYGNESITAFDCDSSGTWYAGTNGGVIEYSKVSQPIKRLNYGRLHAIAGSKNGLFAAATSSSQILLFRCNDTSAVLIDSIQHNSSGLMLSSDATVLASQTIPSAADSSLLHIFDVASHNTMRKFPIENIYERSIVGFDLSQNGKFISLLFGKRSEVFDINQNTVILNVNQQLDLPPQISPDGRYCALSVDSLVKIYKSDKLINAVEGYWGGWYNEDTIIVNKYSFKWLSKYTGSWERTGTYLADTSGKLDSSLIFQTNIVRPVIMSDSELFVHETQFILDKTILIREPGWSIYNFKSGAKMFTTTGMPADSSPSIAALIGKDKIVFLTPTALNVVNWREQKAGSQPRTAKSPQKNKYSLYFSGNRITTTFDVQSQSIVEVSSYSLQGRLLNSINLGNLHKGRYSLKIPLSEVLKGHVAKSSVIIVLKINGTLAGSEKIVYMGKQGS